MGCRDLNGSPVFRNPVHLSKELAQITHVLYNVHRSHVLIPTIVNRPITAGIQIMYEVHAVVRMDIDAIVSSGFRGPTADI